MLQRSSFKAVSHAVVVRLLSPRPDRLSLRVTSQGTTTTVGPLDNKPHPDGGFVYEHTFYLKEVGIVYLRLLCYLAILDRKFRNIYYIFSFPLWLNKQKGPSFWYPLSTAKRTAVGLHFVLYVTFGLCRIIKLDLTHSFRSHLHMANTIIHFLCTLYL